MARLLLEVGLLSSELNVTDAQAQRVLEGFLKAHTIEVPPDDYIDMTDQQKLDKCVEMIGGILVDFANRYERLQARRDADLVVSSDPPSLA